LRHFVPTPGQNVLDADGPNAPKCHENRRFGRSARLLQEADGALFKPIIEDQMTTTSTRDADDPLSAAMAAAGLTPGRSPEPVRLPDPKTLFSRRATRLHRLSSGHSLAQWLDFVSRLCEAQHRVANLVTAAPLAPEAAWPGDLRALAAHCGTDLPPQAQSLLADLGKQDDEALVRLQDDGRSKRPSDLALAAVPFLAAALQIAWARHAALQDAAAIRPPAIAITCPVCGEPPVAGLILIGAQAGGLRYLHCGRCQTAWHHVRATCVACGDAETVGYRLIAGGAEAVRAETCGACHSYLKLMFLDKDPDLDPIADDLASLTLDLLVGEEGFQRIGNNPFLVIPAAPYPA
jgi:FdhE protein